MPIWKYHHIRRFIYRSQCTPMRLQRFFKIQTNHIVYYCIVLLYSIRKNLVDHKHVFPTGWIFLDECTHVCDTRKDVHSEWTRYGILPWHESEQWSHLDVLKPPRGPSGRKKNHRLSPGCGCSGGANCPADFHV